MKEITIINPKISMIKIKLFCKNLLFKKMSTKNGRANKNLIRKDVNLSKKDAKIICPNLIFKFLSNTNFMMKYPIIDI